MLPQVLTNLSIGTGMLHIMDNYYYKETNNFYFIFNFVLWFILSDFIFFFVHINLHRKQLYWLHKKHHEYIYTYGLGAIYSSCFEFVFGNIFPLGETYGNIADIGRRPRGCFYNIFKPQLGCHCKLIFDGHISKLDNSL